MGRICSKLGRRGRLRRRGRCTVDEEENVNENVHENLDVDVPENVDVDLTRRHKCRRTRRRRCRCTRRHRSRLIRSWRGTRRRKRARRLWRKKGSCLNWCTVCVCGPFPAVTVRPRFTTLIRLAHSNPLLGLSH